MDDRSGQSRELLIVKGHPQPTRPEQELLELFAGRITNTRYLADEALRLLRPADCVHCLRAAQVVKQIRDYEPPSTSAY